MEDKKIRSVCGCQMGTEKEFEFNAPIFIDTTGDAFVAHLAGAECMYGREGKDAFNEKYAPEKADHITMGSSLMFKAVDMGEPTPYEKPFWANTYTEEDLVHRGHSNISAGYWWIELGGDQLHTIDDNEVLRDELLKAIYGVWDHIKNGGDHGADNYALEWVGCVPGKRESRRVVGDYVLNENDLFEGRIFEDAVAYGGWPMDMHIPGGLNARKEPTEYIKMNNVYTIPYRSLYSKGIDNLMIGGRAISASRMAFGSTRVMATCAVVGQAIGTAAAMAAQKGIMPREVNNYIKELQHQLIKDDCYIPGYKDNDPAELAKGANITASSQLIGYESEKVIDGFQRNTADENHCWVSENLGDDGEWISLKFDKEIKTKEIHIRFDSNLSKEIMITMSDHALKKQIPGMPPQLVKDYIIECYDKGNVVYSKEFHNNYLRFKTHHMYDVECDEIKIKVLSTYGDLSARIFEVKVY